MFPLSGMLAPPPSSWNRPAHLPQNSAKQPNRGGSPHLYGEAAKEFMMRCLRCECMENDTPVQRKCLNSDIIKCTIFRPSLVSLMTPLWSFIAPLQGTQWNNDEKVLVNSHRDLPFSNIWLHSKLWPLKSEENALSCGWDALGTVSDTPRVPCDQCWIKIRVLGATALIMWRASRRNLASSL